MPLMLHVSGKKNVFPLSTEQTEFPCGFFHISDIYGHEEVANYKHKYITA